MADPGEWQGPPAPDSKPSRPVPAHIKAAQALVADTANYSPEERMRVARALEAKGWSVPVSSEMISPSRWHHPPPVIPNDPNQLPRPPMQEQLEELGRDKLGDRPPPPSYYDPANESGHRKPLGGTVSMPTVFFEPARGDDESKEQYAQRADDAYRGEIDRARARNETVQRYRDIDMGTRQDPNWGGIAQKTLLAPLPYLGAMAQNFSDVEAFGVPARAMSSVMPESAQSLEHLSDEGVDMPGFGAWNFLTTLRGAARGGTPTARLSGRIAQATGATRPAAKFGAQVLGGAVSGATMPAIEEGVEAATDIAQGRPIGGIDVRARVADDAPSHLNGEGRPVDPAVHYDVTQDGRATGTYNTPEEAKSAQRSAQMRNALLPIGIGAGFGAAGGAVAHGVQSLAEADMLARRQTQHDLVPAEAAGIYPAPNARGFQLPPRIEAAERLAARQPSGSDLPGLGLMGTPAEDITARGAARRGARALQTYRKDTRTRTGAERDAYYPTPEGQQRYTGDQPGGPLERIEGITKGAKSADGRPLPLRTVDVYERYAGMFRNGELIDPRTGASPSGSSVSLEEARRMGIPFDETKLDQMAAAETGGMTVKPRGPANQGMVGGKPITTHDRAPGPPKSVQQIRNEGQYVPNDKLVAQKKAELEKTLRVSLSPRDFNAEELETTIRAFQDEVKGIAHNQRSTDVEKKIVGALMDMRKNFKRNPGDAEDWASMRARHGSEISDMEDSFRIVGLPISIDDVDPNTKQVFGAILSTLKRAREEGTDEASLQKLMRRLGQHEPGLEEAVTDLAGHRAYKRLRGQDRDAFRGVASERGVRGYGTIGEVARFVGRRVADPLETRLTTGAPRPKPKYPQSKKPGGQVSPELDTRAGRGLGAARGGRIGNLAANNDDHVRVFGQWLAEKLGLDDDNDKEVD